MTYQVGFLYRMIFISKLLISNNCFHESSSSSHWLSTMIYSIDAIAMLERLGIPLGLVVERNLTEFAEATSLVQVDADFGGREHLLDPLAASAWHRLRAAAKGDGVTIYLVSAFRSVQRQTEIIERKIRHGLSTEQILEFSAPPFFSEHHTGCAVDVGTLGATDLEQGFEKTDAFLWLTQNAVAFGFVMSYPLNNPLGFAYEPWHWRYEK
jgi:D-alanyl-D-alanine carboxypeptidase